MGIFNQETLLPVGMVITMITSVGTALYSHGRSDAKNEATRERVRANEKKLDEIEKSAIPNAERMATMETKLENILSVLKDIDLHVRSGGKL